MVAGGPVRSELKILLASQYCGNSTFVERRYDERIAKQSVTSCWHTNCTTSISTVGLDDLMMVKIRKLKGVYHHFSGSD